MLQAESERAPVTHLVAAGLNQAMRTERGDHTVVFGREKSGTDQCLGKAFRSEAGSHDFQQRGSQVGDRGRRQAGQAGPEVNPFETGFYLVRACILARRLDSGDLVVTAVDRLPAEPGGPSGPPLRAMPINASTQSLVVG